MDSISGNTEFIESLKYLSPPVKRHSSREALGVGYIKTGNHNQLLRGIQQKLSKRDIYTKSPVDRTFARTVESSLHYLLSETKKEKQDKSETKDKPVIKVTVIPKSESRQTSKVLRRRKYIPTPIQGTVSEQDNSLQSKNVCMVVEGRRKEKIYEIKTSGSATTSSEKESNDYTSKHEHLKELIHLKRLIQTLDMDKRTVNNKKSNESEKSDSNFERNAGNEHPHSEGSRDTEKNIPKSRCKMFGQLGINQEDQYVLRYGASIYNKPVLSDFTQMKRDSSPENFRSPSTSPEYDHSYDYIMEFFKDKEVQADYHKEFDCVRFVQTEAMPSKAAQGTQVNFCIEFKPKSSNMKSQIIQKLNHKKTQCPCIEVNKENNTVTENQNDSHLHNSRQSPLVIISVYPKQNSYDITKSYDVYPKEEIIVDNTTLTNNVSMPVQRSIPTKPNKKKADKSTEKLATEYTTRNKSVATHSSPTPPNKSPGSRMPNNVNFEARVVETVLDSNKTNAGRQKIRKSQEKDKIKDISTTSNIVQNPKNPQASKALQRIRNRSTSNSPPRLTVHQPPKYKERNSTIYHTPNVEPDINNQENMMEVPVKDKSTSTSNGLINKELKKHKNAPKINMTPNIANSSKDQQNKNEMIPTRKENNIKSLSFPQPRQHRISTLKESGTNTDHAQAKKALIDNFTKILTEGEKVSKKYTDPDESANSKLKIYVDGDKEYYNVLFNDNPLTTDVTVKKVTKDVQAGNRTLSASLENLFKLPNSSDRIEKSVSSSESDDSPGLKWPTMPNASRLTIRDSLEISHRREEHQNNANHGGGQNNNRNTQSYFVANFDKPIREDRDDLAPIKHYTGDDCVLGDPIERDKQIRELLGVNKNNTVKTKTRQESSPDQHRYHRSYRQECVNRLVTDLNLVELLPCFKNKKPLAHTTSTQYDEFPFQQGTCGSKLTFDGVNIDTITSHIGPTISSSTPIIACGNRSQGVDRTQYCKPFNTFTDAFRQRENFCREPRYCNKVKHNSGYDKIWNNYSYANCEETCSAEIIFGCSNDDCDRYCNPSQEKSTSIYQQLILNRNIQIFLQLEQFSKQKPIILTRKQYEKVKKTIQKTISIKSSQDRKKCFNKNKTREKRSEVYIGEVKTKRLQNLKLHYNKEIQTGSNLIKSYKTVDCECQQPYHKDGRKSQKKEPPQNRGHNQTMSQNVDQSADSYELYNQGASQDDIQPELFKNKAIYDNECINPCNGKRTMMLFCKDPKGLKQGPNNQPKTFNSPTRNTISSLEVRYSSLANMKRVSSTKLQATSNTSITLVNSFHTIFKGYRKSPTPNLGTSAYSLNSEGRLSYTKSAKLISPEDSKPRKPFLRRLMSCLVMRSAGTSDLNMPLQPVLNVPSMDSSLDSYYINTSLGAVDLNSSIYDTSASFYSNHTVLPVNTKMKRGFFSSVREFLSRKS